MVFNAVYAHGAQASPCVTSHRRNVEGLPHWESAPCVAAVTWRLLASGMKLELVPCDSPPAELRERYFRSLPEPQASHVEKRVAASRTFRFGDATPGDAGYAAIHDGAIVEFFAGDGWLPRLSEAFYAVAQEVGAHSALVKTYDALAIAAATGRPTTVNAKGVICTTWTDERFEPPAGFVPRMGRRATAISSLRPGSLRRHPRCEAI